MKHKFIQTRELLDEELRALYKDKGKIPDMSHFEHKHRRRATRVLLVLVIFLAILTAASWTGFFLFGPQGGGGEVELDFQGPEVVVSGVPQDITLHYKNMDRDPLAFAKLQFRAPENLLIKQVEPRPDSEERLEWNIGTLPAKSSRSIHLTVVPYGVENNKINLQALFTFKPANFNAEFQTSASHEFEIRAGAIKVEIGGPEQAASGQKLLLRGKIKNVTDEPFENLYAALNAPSSFLLDKIDSGAKPGEWEIGKLEPGEERELSFSGILLSNARGPQTIAVEIRTKTSDGSPQLLAQGAHIIQAASADLEIALLINENPQPSWIRIDQDINLRLNLTNKGKTSFENIKIGLDAKGDLLDWTSAKAEEGSIDNGRFIFPKENGISIAPSAAREFKATLKTANAARRASSPFIEIFGEITYGENVLRTMPIKLTVVSDLRLDTQARYYDAGGTPIGSGPLPPRVGEETKYRIRWHLKNTFHDLSDIAVIANLPQGGRWTGTTEASAGKIAFNETTREVRWEIPRMPVTTPELNASFELGITPTSAERGQLALLLGVARVEALDTISQTAFSADAPSLSSNLDADPLGKGKGVVE